MHHKYKHMKHTLTAKQLTGLKRRMPPLIDWWCEHIINQHPDISETQYRTAIRLLEMPIPDRSEYMIYGDRLLQRPETTVISIKHSKNLTC